MASVQPRDGQDIGDTSFSLDPEASPIPGQQAWAILDLHGAVVKSSANDAPIVRDATTLYSMLVESTPLVAASGGLRRMTVHFGSVRYVVALDDHHIYLLQTKG